jgi:hypothetical protein
LIAGEQRCAYGLPLYRPGFLHRTAVMDRKMWVRPPSGALVEPSDWSRTHPAKVVGLFLAVRVRSPLPPRSPSYQNWHMDSAQTRGFVGSTPTEGTMPRSHNWQCKRLLIVEDVGSSPTWGTTLRQPGGGGATQSRPRFTSNRFLVIQPGLTPWCRTEAVQAPHKG